MALLPKPTASGRPAASADTVPASVARALLNTRPGAMVLVDAADTVAMLTGEARRLLPGTEPGAALADTGPWWLAAAHAGGRGEARGEGAAGAVTAECQRLPEGYRAWLLAEGGERPGPRRREAGRDGTEFLVRASTRLLSSLNWDRCVRSTAELASEGLADLAVVVTSEGRRLRTVYACDGAVLDRRALREDVVAEVPGLADALAGFPPVSTRWVDPSQAPDWLLPDGFGPIGSIMVTPMPGNGVPAGALILLRRPRQHEFSESDEVFARIFAARAGAAISAASLYAHKAQTTAVLQKALLPPRLERISGLELAASYRSARAEDEIGGDFYDIHPPVGAGGETFLFLGDVCGKGADAAVMTGKIRNTLAALCRIERDHARLLRLLNDTLLDDTDARFATLVLAGATPLGSGGVRLRLTAAGHPAPLIVRGDGYVEAAVTSGSLIGALPLITTQTYETVLVPGDICLLYTDGITEAQGGRDGAELFGEERLRRALGECARTPVEAAVERVEMLAAQWLRGRDHDDMALLAIGASRGQHLSVVDGTGRGRYTG